MSFSTGELLTAVCDDFCWLLVFIEVVVVVVAVIVAVGKLDVVFVILNRLLQSQFI